MFIHVVKLYILPKWHNLVVGNENALEGNEYIMEGNENTLEGNEYVMERNDKKVESNKKLEERKIKMIVRKEIQLVGTQ